MEDLKEMFAQIMKFQMESQQKKTRKTNNGSSLNCKNNK